MLKYSDYEKTETGFKLKDGAAPGSYVINVSNGKIKDGLLEADANENFLKITVDYNTPDITIPDEVKALLPEQ